MPTTPLHWPEPVSPLAFSVLERGLAPAITAAARAYSVQLGEVAVRRVDTHVQLEVSPPAAPDEEAAAQAGGARSRAALEAAMAGLRQTWEREYLPEIHLHLAAWESVDLPGTAMADLLVHLDDAVIRFGRLLELHFLVRFPAALAMAEFDALLSELDLGDPGELLMALPTRTTEAENALWRLSRTVRELPGALATLVSHWPSTGALLAALRSTPDGSEFLGRLRGHLQEYGQRADRAFEFDHPSRVEDPTPVLDRVRTLVARPDDDDPAVALREQAGCREQARADARRRLAGAAPEVRERFEFLLAAASTAIAVTEDRAFWIDFRSTHQVRRVLSELGWRLVPAAVNVPADVFLLTLDELRETAAAERTPDRRALVETRRTEMDGGADAAAPDPVAVLGLLRAYGAPAAT